MSPDKTPAEIIANLLAEHLANGRGMTREQDTAMYSALRQLAAEADLAGRDSKVTIPPHRVPAMREHARAEYTATVKRLGRRGKEKP